MKIFRCDQIREIDRNTIVNEPVASVDLMERAAGQLLRWYMRSYDRSRRILIFVGPGNNGGDGLAFARLLAQNRYNPEVFFIKITSKTSANWNINRKRLETETSVPFVVIDSMEKLPLISSDDIVVDAIFGSGLARPVEGLAASIIKELNRNDCIVISVDIPSGLFGEDNSKNTPESIVRADITLTFQFPKLSFMFADNSKYVGEWITLPIGLDKNSIASVPSPFMLLDNSFISSLLKKRNKFDHKGIYGHGLLVAGSSEKTGAAILGARAALRTGIGLLTCQLPGNAVRVFQSAVPEAMVKIDSNSDVISETLDNKLYDAIGIGPGIGTTAETHKAFHSYLLNRDKSVIIDADGINILGQNKKWISALPHNTILTPHLKEFERIAGPSNNGFKRLETQIEFSVKHYCVVVLKGANTSISSPDGKVYFNVTGNPGMATAGSGDVLTGIILSLLAQGYSIINASLTGVFIHGLAGDIAAAKSSYESLIASDIVDNIGSAFRSLRNPD